MSFNNPHLIQQQIILNCKSDLVKLVLYVVLGTSAQKLGWHSAHYLTQAYSSLYTQMSPKTVHLLVVWTGKNHSSNPAADFYLNCCVFCLQNFPHLFNNHDGILICRFHLLCSVWRSFMLEGGCVQGTTTGTVGSPMHLG